MVHVVRHEKYPKYCMICKHLGHDADECRGKHVKESDKEGLPKESRILNNRTKDKNMVDEQMHPTTSQDGAQTLRTTMEGEKADAWNRRKHNCNLLLSLS